MSNYIEYNDRVAFHPGYYIKEIIDESGLTQADFAKRLGTTPKNISILVRGEQALSVDIANKLSMLLGTSISYWLGLQQAYDELSAEFMRLDELEREKETFKHIDYGYFRQYYKFPDLPRKIDEQITKVREYLSVASLTVLEETDLAVDFRNCGEVMTLPNIVNSNIMLQIAVNEALEADIPKFNKRKFEETIVSLLPKTKNQNDFIPAVKKELEKCGVYLAVIPGIKNSGISGATKRVDGRVMILVNEKYHYEDTFWFTLFHEIGHVLNGELGASSEKEAKADSYAKSMLIPDDKYHDFILECKNFDEKSIASFADTIDRDPGIVLGRLLIEHKVSNSNTELCNRLRKKILLDELYEKNR